MHPLLHDSCLQCLTKREAAQLTGVERDLRPALGHWLFLHHARPRTNLRLYILMLHELRRMGLFPLYVMLHSPLNVDILRLAFSYFKDRQSQFSTPSISRFFRFTTPPATMTQAQEFSWRQSRLYLQALQASLQQRYLFAYLALCEHDPQHATQRYPLGAHGLSIMEQLVSESLWPQTLLRLLLREMKVPSPLLWWPHMALAENRFTQRWVRRQKKQAWQQWLIAGRSRVPQVIGAGR